MHWDFWDLMLLTMSLEIPLLIVPELIPATSRWLPPGRSHFKQLAMLVLTAIFLYGVFWFIDHARF